MLDGLKSKLGFRQEEDYDEEFYDDYDTYTDNFDDYSTYDEEEDDVDYSDYGEYGYDDDADYAKGADAQAPAAIGSRPSRTTRPSGRSSDRRRSSHPPLVSMDEVRASTPLPSLEPPASRRSSALGRNSVGHASDYALSGAELADTPLGDAPVESSSATGTARRGGYNSLFDSTPSVAASAGAERASRTSASELPGSYDPYKAYEGTGAVSHHPARKVVVLTPMSYNEVESVSRTLKAGDAVVLSLTGTPSDLSKRVLDFSFGVASALDASVDCIADKVFAITRNAPLSEAERTRLRAQRVL